MTNNVKEYISIPPEGKPFAAKALRGVASTENFCQILSRLVQAGELPRVARGIFVKLNNLSNLPLRKSLKH